MTALAIAVEPVDPRWAAITAHAPELAATCHHYIDQIAVSLRPASVEQTERCLRWFAGWLIDHDPNIRSLRQLQRPHIAAYKLHLANHRKSNGQPLKKTTIYLRLGGLRVVFERLIEWDHPDAPPRNPIHGTDLPRLDEPLPKFLDDEQAARFMHAATQLDPLRRLVVEMLARTGLRIGEFCELANDAIVTIGDTNWLRVPIGKLHTDRYVPLHPILIELHTTWLDWAGPNTTNRLITNQGQPLNRWAAERMVHRCARLAGIGHVHPHQLRHTLATQAINNGMSLEAIAAMLGHKSMRMTLTYARIADRTVADQYFTAAQAVDQLYTHNPASPA